MFFCELVSNRPENAVSTNINAARRSYGLLTFQFFAGKPALSIFKMTAVSKNNVTLLVIDEESLGQRLDNFLFRTCKGVPKSHVQRIIRNGEVRVNSKRVGSSERLALGDVVRVPPIRIAERTNSEKVEFEEQALSLPINYEDDYLLVIDKPAGVAVHGGSGVSFGVIEALRRQRPLQRFLELAHRLDRETSGLLIVAKKRSALVQLHEMFRGSSDKKIDKRYLVLVKGRWVNSVQHVKLPLFKFVTASGERRVRVSAEGKPSYTIFRLISRWGEYSLLEAELKTGRTHQIRAHCSHLGFPIVGDEKYGDFAFNKEVYKLGARRMFLHSAKTVIDHPILETSLHLEAPLHSDFEKFIAVLRTSFEQDYGKSV